MLQLKNTLNNSSNNATSAGLTQDGDVCCWETQIGQELYKLTITYFGAELSVIALADALRWGLTKSNIWPWFTKTVQWSILWHTLLCILLHIQFGYAEFSLAENVLKLVYGQALVW